MLNAKMADFPKISKNEAVMLFIESMLPVPREITTYFPYHPTIVSYNRSHEGTKTPVGFFQEVGPLAPTLD